MIVTAPKHNLKPFNLTRNDRNLTKSVINLNYNKTGSILGGHLDDMKKRAGLPEVQRCTSARTINYNPYPERIVRTQRRDAMESRPHVEVPMSHSPLTRNGDKNVSQFNLAHEPMNLRRENLNVREGAKTSRDEVKPPTYTRTKYS